eukprot:TRINITY_DN2563_c0_g1_i6.p1 TRINITY_DN2563_c0_g1~~TRINITY_DN2563_c0_g1_i6.p1  ORF type:complete len:207 (-),score=-12.26 TRINITY_DN2563_c0_g1_i6:539-1159(-)
MKQQNQKNTNLLYLKSYLQDLKLPLYFKLYQIKFINQNQIFFGPIYKYQFKFFLIRISEQMESFIIFAIKQICYNKQNINQFKLIIIFFLIIIQAQSSLVQTSSLYNQNQSQNKKPYMQQLLFEKKNIKNYLFTHRLFFPLQNTKIYPKQNKIKSFIIIWVFIQTTNKSDKFIKFIKIQIFISQKLTLKKAQKISKQYNFTVQKCI